MRHEPASANSEALQHGACTHETRVVKSKNPQPFLTTFFEKIMQKNAKKGKTMRNARYNEQHMIMA